MLLENVLKGLKKEFEVGQLTVIRGYCVLFSGSLEVFESGKSNEFREFVNSLLKSEVVGKDNIANIKHFIFIK